jgi:hypothetical protein
LATSKEVYEEIASKLSSLRLSATDLNASLVGVDNSSEVEDDFNEIFNNLSAIDTWVEDNIQRLAEEEVLNGFLTGLKQLMTDYKASFEIGNGDGYGVSYGDASVTGMTIKIEKDGVKAEKVIEKVVITADDV